MSEVLLLCATVGNVTVIKKKQKTNNLFLLIFVRKLVVGVLFLGLFMVVARFPFVFKMQQCACKQETQTVWFAPNAYFKIHLYTMIIINAFLERRIPL